MHPRRPARSHLILPIVVLLPALLLSACQQAAITVVSPAEAVNATTAPLLPDATSAAEPTPFTPFVIPATWTPNPPSAVGTPSLAPSSTATPHFVNTISAATAAWDATVCEKYPEAWQVHVTRSWQTGWCDLNSKLYSWYEYRLAYPSSWKVNTFGDTYPNLIFVTGQPKIELRLYQVFSYEAQKYSGTLEDAPEKAAFCDDSDKCLLVVDPHETLGQRELLTLGAKQVLVLDSQEGTRFVRRYFFRVMFTAYKPQANRLFIVKLYTPTQIQAVSAALASSEEDAPYRNLLLQIENMISTLQQDLDRK